MSYLSLNQLKQYDDNGFVYPIKKVNTRNYTNDNVKEIFYKGISKKLSYE